MIADTVIDEIVHIARHFDAPVCRVYRAWTEPADFCRWWSPGGWKTDSALLDIVPGGTYCIVMRTLDGAMQTLTGTYLEVVTDALLVFTWHLEGDHTDGGDDSIVTVAFTPVGTGTDVHIRHERLPKRKTPNYGRGWSALMEKLAASLNPGDNL